jgi:protein-S-isoprenylcysteine O-methyltransferase Ste14
MTLIPGFDTLTDKVPELTTPRGFLRAAATFLGTWGLAHLALTWLDTRQLTFAFLLQIVLYGVARWLVAGFFRGRADRIPYNTAFFNRFLPSAGINAASLSYLALTHAGAEVPKLVPGWLAFLPALYLLVTGVALIARSVQAAGVDTLFGVYSYFPDEGFRLDWSVYEALRHPIYSGLDRVALALGLLSGTAYGVLLAVIFVFVWHPVWYRLEEEELEGRFGDEYREYRARVPAVIPPDLGRELALVGSLTARPPARPGAEPEPTDEEREI